MAYRITPCFAKIPDSLLLTARDLHRMPGTEASLHMILSALCPFTYNLLKFRLDELNATLVRYVIYPGRSACMLSSAISC